MRVKLGDLELANPVMVASGTFGCGTEYSGLVDVRRLGAVVTKTVTREPREGNPAPRIAETPAGMLNSIGLENPGVERFLERVLPEVAALGAPVVVNIAGDEPADYAYLAGRLSKEPAVRALELNVSCPNVNNFLNGVTQDNFVTVASVFESSLEAPPTNERWKTVTIDAGTGNGPGSPYIITTKEIPAIYQIDIDSLTVSHWLKLPAASTCIGYELIVYVVNGHATYSLIIDPDGTDQIIGTSTAGDYIYSNTNETFVHMIALVSGRWAILNADGLPTGWIEE